MKSKVINRGFVEIYGKIREAELEVIRKKDLDITVTQWNYLVWLSEHPNKTITDLSKILGIQKGTLSNNIKFLIKKDLVKKKEVGRLINIHPTEKGREYIAIHEQIHNLIHNKMSSVLTDEEMEQLEIIGEKLINGL